jgi:hypothetical protein
MRFPLCRGGSAVRRGFSASALAFPIVLSIAAIAPASAQNLVTNGTFSTPGVTQSFQFGTYGGYTPPQALSGWTSSGGYNFVFLPTSTVAVGVSGNLSLWSPVSSPSSANGFTNASPTGGNFAGADGAYGQADISQTINNLKIGHSYAVSFAWGGAQQSGYTAANGTTENWQVTFGSVTQTTKTITIANEGFSGWLNQTFDFVATATSETLSFFATGTPTGVPPFALLANVSVIDAPEPASLAMMLSGLTGLIGFARRRRGLTQRPGQPSGVASGLAA